MKLNKILLYINLFFLQSYLVRFQIGPYPSNLQEILIGLNALVFFIAVIKEKQFFATIKNLKKHWIIISFTLLFVFSALTNWPPLNNLDFLRHTKFLFFALVLVFIFLETFKTAAEKKQALKIAGIGALTFGLFSIIYNLAGFNTTLDQRFRGPLDSAVYLAYYLTPFFLFYLFEFFQNKKRQELLIAIALGLIIVSTKSMGAIGGSFFIAAFYLFRQSELKVLKNRISKVVLAISTILIVATIFHTKILPTLETDYSSLDERGEIWLTSYELLKNPKNFIFGLGPGQFQENYAQNADQALGHKPLDYIVLQPHNIFLLFWLNYGILGLIFIFLTGFLTLYKIFTAKKTDFESISCLILLYFLLHGLIDTPFFKNDLLILLILTMEISLANLTLKSQTESCHKNPSRESDRKQNNNSSTSRLQKLLT